MFAGCERMSKNVKHFQSGFTGLNRRITLYGCDGMAVRTWEGKFMIEQLDNPYLNYMQPLFAETKKFISSEKNKVEFSDLMLGCYQLFVTTSKSESITVCVVMAIIYSYIDNISFSK